MSYLPVTPFRRAVDAALLDRLDALDGDRARDPVDKWRVLRDLTTAREALGVTNRELSVLQALLTFHPETELRPAGRPPIVFPSNASICERLNGMACSTMRRHLAGLVRAGLILRRDSPNGKRFARRDGSGTQAFGFDLRPLILRASEIKATAERVKAALERQKRLRQSVSVMRRDLAGLAAYGAERSPDQALWNRMADLATRTARTLRRRLSVDDLQDIERSLQAGLEAVTQELAREAMKVSTCDRQNEQHQQSSETNDFESLNEPTDIHDTQDRGVSRSDESGAGGNTPASRPPDLPLALIVEACGEASSFSETPIQRWSDFISLADHLRPMMGIPRGVWDDARRVMGAAQAATVLAAILERFGEIRKPGAYLRGLTRRAEEGAFSCAAMIMALVNRSSGKVHTCEPSIAT